MGFWKKLGGGLKKGIDGAAKAVPYLPLPEKIKRVVGKVDAVEDDVTSLVDEFRKPKPTTPPEKPAA